MLSFILSVTLAGAVSESAMHTAPLPAPTAPTRDSIILSGSVRDESGAPIEGAKVCFLSSNGQSKAATTGADGAYALTKFPRPRIVDLSTVDPSDPDPPRVTVWAGSAKHFLQEFTPPAPEPDAAVLQHDITLVARPSIEVHLTTPAGDPALPALYADEVLKSLLLTGLHAVATPEPPPKETAIEPTSAGLHRGVGLFTRVAGGSAAPSQLGTLTLDSAGPCHVSLVAFQQVVATRALVPGEHQVHFTVTPEELRNLLGEIRVRFLYGEEATPLLGEGALLSSRWARRSPMEPGTRTDEAGFLVLKNVPPGRRWLEFRPDAIRGPGSNRKELAARLGVPLSALPKSPPSWQRLRRFVRAVDVPSGATLTLPSLQYESNQRASGAAVDRVNTPRRTALTLRRVLEDGSISTESSARFLGSVERGLHASAPPGLYQVEVPGASDREDPDAEIWCGEPFQLDLRNGPVKDLRVEVQRGVHVHILSPTLASRLHSGLRTEFIDSRGQLRHPARSKAGYVLPPGRYTVRRRYGDRTLATQTIELKDQPLTVVFHDDVPGIPK